MTEPTYIHVAMHGHFDGKLAVKYAFNADDAEWMASLPDPDAIVRNFMSVRECYVMWRNEFGHYFSMITSDPLDPKAGRMMVTVMADNGCMLAGRSVFTALSGLKKTFLEDRILTDQAVTEVLKAASVPEEPVELPAWQWSKPSDDAARPMPLCYRTYLSTRELEGVFSFPEQPEYERYVYDIIINATSSLRPGIAIDRLTSPIRRIYSVVCPEGVTSSADTVADGRQITLTFTKDGFSPRKETVTAGVPSAYVIYDGSLMKVKSPAGPNMGFVRKVRLTIKNSKGGLINGYTVSVNDRPVNTMEPFIELTEADLQPGRRVEIQVASNNFHPLTKEYEAAELAREQEIELTMVPVEQGITLRLVFGEGRVFEQQISLEKNTPEYSQLHSGNFHGFRAQKMVTPHGGEVYNVDVRAASKPTAPAFANIAAERNQSRPERVVPHFENVADTQPRTSSDDSHRTPVSEIAPVEEKPLPNGKTTDENDSYSEEHHRSNRHIGRWIAVAAAAAAVIAGVIFLIPSMTDNATGNLPENNESVTAEATTATPTATSAQPSAATVLSNDEKADADYLNSQKVWRLADLKSESYRNLFEMIRKGDIEGMASHDYFAADGRATNEKAIKIIDMAWGSLGASTEGSNRKALTKSVSKDDEIVVHDLYEALSRRMPKEPNTQPRPRR